MRYAMTVSIAACLVSAPDAACPEDGLLHRFINLQAYDPPSEAIHGSEWRSRALGAGGARRLARERFRRDPRDPLITLQ